MIVGQDNAVGPTLSDSLFYFIGLVPKFWTIISIVHWRMATKSAYKFGVGQGWKPTSDNFCPIPKNWAG